MYICLNRYKTVYVHITFQNTFNGNVNIVDDIIRILYDLYDGKKILSFLCNNKIYAFIAIWIVYILIHGNMSMETEFYRTYYLCVSLFSTLESKFIF